jgi:hypothetical protein
VGTTLHVLLVADACLRDARGRPTLTPDASTLGMPAGVTVDVRRSFLRSRRYSGWNAHRGGPEMERQVLAAGGVVTLRSPQGFDDALLERLSRGIGTERALGLGEVLLHPQWLRGLKPDFGTRAAAAGPASQPEPARRAARTPDTPLLRVLAQRAAATQGADTLQGVVAQAQRRLAERWLAVRRYLAEPPERAWGPGASQWGALAQAAARATSIQELREALLGARDGIVSRRLAVAGAPPKEFWDATAPGADGEPSSLAHWVSETLDTLQQVGEAEAPRLDAWQRLCDTVRRQQPHVNEAALARLLPREETA